jgi:hypothetical protein
VENIMKIIEEEKKDIISIKEKYNLKSEVDGIKKIKLKRRKMKGRSCREKNKDRKNDY